MWHWALVVWNQSSSSFSLSQTNTEIVNWNCLVAQKPNSNLLTNPYRINDVAESSSGRVSLGCDDYFIGLKWVRRLQLISPSFSACSQQRFYFLYSVCSILKLYSNGTILLVPFYLFAFWFYWLCRWTLRQFLVQTEMFQLFNSYFGTDIHVPQRINPPDFGLTQHIFTKHQQEVDIIIHTYLNNTWWPKPRPHRGEKKQRISFKPQDRPLRHL